MKQSRRLSIRHMGLFLGLMLFSGPVFAQVWGTDSRTQSCCGIPQDFYVGKFGEGLEQSTFYFNVAAAQVAGSPRTYAYWFMVGPQFRPDGVSPYDWGVMQAYAAIDARYTHPYAPLVEGPTIFADIELQVRYGWNNIYDDRQVLNGFLEAFDGQPDRVPGVYTSVREWYNIFRTDWLASRPFTLWISGCRTCAIRCAPCDLSCWTTMEQVRDYLPDVQNVSLGGSQAVVWQYYIGSCGCGDFNVAVSPAENFRPIYSGVAYQCAGCGLPSYCP